MESSNKIFKSSEQMGILPGDNISRPIAGMLRAAYHHGIYIGKENGVDMVIHYNNEIEEEKSDGENVQQPSNSGSGSFFVSGSFKGSIKGSMRKKQAVKIVKWTLEQFMDGQDVITVNLMDRKDRKYSAEVCVQRAKELEGKMGGGYNFVANNCEAFVIYCLYDYTYSRQSGVASNPQYTIAVWVVSVGLIGIAVTSWLGFGCVGWIMVVNYAKYKETTKEINVYE